MRSWRALQLAQDEPTRQQRAGEAKEALSKVSKAFEESEPKAMQMAQKTDSLKPGEQESFNQGMAELESLLKQLAEQAADVARETRPSKARRRWATCGPACASLYGDNERGNQLLAQAGPDAEGRAAGGRGDPEEADQRAAAFLGRDRRPDGAARRTSPR